MPAPTSRPVPARARFLRGVRLGSPILLSYVAVGAAFGVVSGTVGLTPLQAVTCSALVLAGAGQFIALSMLGGGAGALAVIAATGIVNLRYVLFGATLAPHVRAARPAMLGWLGFTLTDETFAVNITDAAEGTADPVSMAGVGAVSWAGWVLGTAIGALAAGGIGDPTRWGVDFAMPAMFTALLVAQAEDRRHVIVGILAAAIAVVCALVLPGAWYIVAAALGAATIGAAVFRR